MSEIKIDLPRKKIKFSISFILKNYSNLVDSSELAITRETFFVSGQSGSNLILIVCLLGMIFIANNVCN